MIAAQRRRFGPVTGQAVLVAAATQPTSPIASKIPTHITSARDPARAAAIPQRAGVIRKSRHTAQGTRRIFRRDQDTR